MRKNEIICAFYNPEVERFDKYHSFMKVVVENQKKIEKLNIIKVRKVEKIVVFC